MAWQEMTPNPAPENINTTRQGVAKHLRVWTDCELIKKEKQGREVYFSLEIIKMKVVDKWLEEFRKIWETGFH